MYGDSYDRWAAGGDDESIKKWIEDTGLTPEENYKVRAFDADLLPSDIYRAWLEARRDMLRDIPDDFEILSASPKDDTTMTVTAEVYGINTMELAGRVRTAKTQVLSDDWVLIINQTDDAELKKRDQMANFYLLEGMVRNEFADLDTSFSETPITSEPIKVEFDTRRQRQLDHRARGLQSPRLRPHGQRPRLPVRRQLTLTLRDPSRVLFLFQALCRADLRDVAIMTLLTSTYTRNYNTTLIPCPTDRTGTKHR